MGLKSMNNKSFGKGPRRQSYYLLGKMARFVSLSLVERIAATGLKPNDLTLISFVFSIFAALFYSFGSYHGNIAAMLCYWAFFIVDHMDGDLARYLGMESVTGQIKDHVYGKLTIILVYLGISAGLARTHDPAPIWFTAFMLMAGLLGSQSLLSKRKMIVMEKNIAGHKFDLKKQFSPSDSLPRILFKEVTALHMATIYLILVGSIFNKLYFALVLTAGYVWLYYFYQISASISYFKRVDKQEIGA